MVFIDRVVSYDADAHSVETEIVVSEKSLFFDAALGGVPAYVAVEYFAQTIGCFAGIFDLSQDPPKRPGVGFVLGTRKFESAVAVLAPGRFRVRARELFFDSEIASFECSLHELAGTQICSASLNAYRPADIEQLEKIIHG